MLEMQGRKGASFIQKHRLANPREWITRLYEDNPQDSREVLFNKFSEMLKEDEEAQRTVDWYFFVNMYEYIATSRNTKFTYGNKRPRSVRRAEAQNLKEAIAKVVLLDLILPSGKLLRQATFSECAKAGGWFTKISKLGKPQQIVGKVLSEDRLRAIKFEIATRR